MKQAIAATAIAEKRINNFFHVFIYYVCTTIIRLIRIISGKSVSGPYNTPMALLKEFLENQPLASHIAFIVVSYMDRHKKRFAVA
jgi:hypothetical protein